MTPLPAANYCQNSSGIAGLAALDGENVFSVII
jgi:hypothetical protein